MIFCPQCHHENRDHARFCAQCGTALMSSASDQAWPAGGRPVASSSGSSAMPFGSGDTGPLEEERGYFAGPKTPKYDRNDRNRRSRAHRKRGRSQSRRRSAVSRSKRARRRQVTRSARPRAKPSPPPSASYDHREDRWDNRWDHRADHQRNEPRNGPYGNGRARSVRQGNQFRVSSLPTANLRQLSSEDYDNQPVTNGQPYAANPAPASFLTKKEAPSPFGRVERRDRNSWAAPERSEATNGRKEDEQPKRAVTVVPNEPSAAARDNRNNRNNQAPVREPADQVITEPLSPLAVELSPLPIGELLNKRRYVIVSLVEQQATENLYLVKDRLHRQCVACGERENKRDELQCRTCGVEWSEQAYEAPRYFLRETFDQPRFEQQAAIAQAKLRHPRITPLLQAFSEQPYGPKARFYLLSEANEGVSLTSLSRPQPESQVLSWGRQVADGLIYLHGQGVAYRQLGLAQVILAGGQAKLSDLSHAQRVPEYAPTIWQADEVDALGDMLFKLLDPLALSAPTTALFERFAHSQDRFLTMQAFADVLDETLQQLQENVKLTHLVGQSTHVGQQRTLNQDYLLTLKFEHAYLTENKAIGLYIVADGLGGQAAGELASQLAVRTITQIITEKVMLDTLSTVDTNAKPASQPPDYAAWLKEACLKANEVLHERRLQANNDMGTTVVAALVVEGKSYIANVGDSRAYFIHQGQMNQLTTDHSLVGRLLSLGQITPEQARTHPQRHVIYRTLGEKPQVEIDIFEKNVQASDALVLCTDGLYGMVNETLIEQQVMQSPHPQAACDKLVLLANQAGGEDNMAVIVIKIEEVG